MTRTNHAFLNDYVHTAHYYFLQMVFYSEKAAMQVKK
jgi:hypothetical protein